jgi:hypothetical protein
MFGYQAQAVTIGKPSFLISLVQLDVSTALPPALLVASPPAHAVTSPKTATVTTPAMKFFFTIGFLSVPLHFGVHVCCQQVKAVATSF